MYWLLLVAAPSAAPLVVCSMGVCFGSSGCFEPRSRWPHPRMREALIATTFNKGWLTDFESLLKCQENGQARLLRWKRVPGACVLLGSELI